MLLNSFVLLMALPFLIAFFALSSAFKGVRALKDDLVERKPVRATMRAGFVWLAVIVAIPALFMSNKIYSIWFPDVEEGRDRLGRICVDEGSSVRCRPDPANRHNPFEGRRVADLERDNGL